MMRIIYYLLGIHDAGSIRSASDFSWHTAAPVATWLVWLVVVVGLGAAALNLLPQSVMRWRMRFGLTALRLMGFALLLMMLTQLEMHVKLERSVRPNVAIVTDVSASMELRDVNGQTRLEAARALAAGITPKLADEAAIAAYRFNWQLEQDEAKTAPAPGGMTRLVDSLGELARRENDLQAVVLLTDGNDTNGNKGQLLSPVLASRGIKVFPVTFGEAGGARMASVKLASGGAYVRLGDELRLTAALSAGGSEQVVSVRLMEQGRKEPIASRENIRLGKEPVEVSFVVKPEVAGPRTYQIVMDGIKDAASSRMLAAEHKVQVINSRIHVLYLDIPRDERKILGYWLSRDPVIDLATLTLMPKGGWYAQGAATALLHKNAGDGLPNAESDLYKYDVIILGDIPRAYFRENGDVAETKMQRLVEFVARRGGGLITLGGRSVYGAGQYQDSALARIIPFGIEATDSPQVPKPFRLIPTAAGLSHPLMQLEGESAANRDTWLDLPLLDGCNRVGKIKPGASLLATRDVDGVAMPVMAIQSVGRGQVLSLAADTTWRWEMMRPDEGEDYFRRFWGNAVRALAPDPRIQPNQPQVLQLQTGAPVGQAVTLATRLVDATYRPLAGADVSVKVTSPAGKVTMYYPRDGRDAPGLYEYQVPLTEAGSWQVAVTHKDKTSIENIPAGTGDEELDDPRAKPDAMAELAAATGGKAFTPAQAAALVEAIKLKPRSFTETAAVPLWNLPLTMILMIAVVCLDTWIRKRRGMV